MNKGWVEVICGPMFAGKTEEVIRRVRRLQYANKKVIIFKPQFDDRYSNSEIVSHNKNVVKAVEIDKAIDIFKYLTQDTDAIVVDEVQFLDNEIIDIIEFVADQGIRVIVAGLDKDFKGDPFGNMGEIIAKADLVEKLTSICSKCGQAATRSQRLLNGEPARYEDEVLLLGASESYEPRCRHCHEVDKKKEYEIRR